MTTVQKMEWIAYAIGILSGVLLLFWALRWVYRKFFQSDADKPTTETYASIQNLKAVGSDLDKEVKAGAKLSYPDSEYYALATQLYGFMGLSSKAKFVEVKPILLKLKNYADLLELKKAFGTKQFGSSWFSTAKDIDLAFQDCADYQSGALWRDLVASFSSSKILSKAKK